MKKRRLPDAQGIQKTLKKTFGFAALRPGQETVIASVLEGHDTLAIMPTGAGKSLCYQLPALYVPGTTVVVSPLISLMKDQSDKLDELGVHPAQINSTLGERDERAELAQISRSRRELVFATPERLSDPEFLAILKRNKIDFVVVDEAHCISEWGHDFRPAFLEIGTALRLLGDPQVLALTATATEPVIDDIRRQLGRPRMRVINTGLYRSNLHYRVVHVTNEEEKRRELHRLLKEHAGSGIIYCATVKKAVEVYEALSAAGEPVACYHGRLSARERRENQDAFMSGAKRIMIATNAFGLGIDKHDIRFIVHYQVPGSIDAYYQESGRAGRDGDAALCVLLYDVSDRRVQQFFLGGRYPDADQVVAVADRLSSAGNSGATVADLRESLSHIPANKQRVALKLLRDEGLVQLTRDGRHRLLQEGTQPARIARCTAAYRERGESDREKLERMLFYAQTMFCRWKVILEYYGAAGGFERCHRCDNCLRPEEQPRPRQGRPTAIRVRRRKTPAFEPGAEVIVPRYGAGRVLSSAADQVEIVFPNGDKRIFLSHYVSLPAPRSAV